MKTSALTIALFALVTLSACAGPRQPQANDCETIHKGNQAAIDTCVQERRSHFWSFL
ncbi:MAG: hypothetical protein JNM12_09955 [Alphaproteobacteria bacterium]|nr:hypothetical protein [Alphaproteobacteria bacterium]